MEIRVATYNVLSSSLCEPSYFTSCKPEDLDPDNRLKRVFARLEEELKLGAIICLQEVSAAWAGPLHTFFQQRGYHLALSLYGGYRNGYMGIGIAFPSDRFEAKEMDMKRLSDSFNLPREPPPPTLSRIVDFLKDRIGLTKKRKQGIWEQSRRTNTLIFARLKDRATGAPVCVATYHMPCAFYAPRVMTLHSAMAAQRTAALANGDPVVLAGDFNLLPDSECYQLLTEGELPKDPVGRFTPVVPKNGKQPDFSWTKLPIKFKSAYKEVEGVEPEFTNYALTRGATDAFIETLDYIFISDNIKPTAVRSLVTKDNAVGPYPTKDEPSDHAMIAATLQVPTKTN